MNADTFDLAYRLAMRRVEAGGGSYIRDQWDALWFALRLA